LIIQKKLVAIGIIATLLTACSFAPPYQRPPMPIPAHYKETGKWVSTQSVPAAKRCGHWWEVFDDPALNKLEEKVICANQNLKAAFARYQEARAAAQVARSAYYPSLIGVASPDRQQVSHNIANPPPVNLYNDFLVGADLNYELDAWGRVRNAVAASEDLACASAFDLAAIDLSLHAELASDYFALRGDELKQRVLDETVVAYEKALYLTRMRHDGGAAPEADVDQAETQLENAKTMAIDMHLKRAQLEHAIAVLVGEIPANFVMTPSQSSMKSISVSPNLPSTLLICRPDIAAAEQRVRAANADIGVARAAFYPDFNLVAVAGFESAMMSNLITKPSLFWALGPSVALTLIQPAVTLVLIDGGRLRGLLNQANAAYYETVGTYRQTVLTAFQEVEDSLVAVRRLDQERRTQTAATVAAKRALVQANYRYYGGLTTFLDVVVVENTALQSELASVDIRTRRQLASVQLIKALGGSFCGKS
jgi:NodT family efflux transporter outer membrane factor (OMF) lipoprotein